MEFRKLFLISYYRYKRNLEFNSFLFWLDLVILTIPLSILLSLAIINIL